MRVLVTGASGFIGTEVVNNLKLQNFEVRTVNRRTFKSEADSSYTIDDLGPDTYWRDVLMGCDVIIHLAARVHVMNDSAVDPLAEFRKVNVAGTVKLAMQAAKAGAKRFVYVSSVKVNGEQAALPYTELNESNPQDSYGVSKWEAEQALHKISATTGLEVVIVRPPLVYGAGVKGNFAQMIKVLAKGVPLPFASVQNLRSLIYIENLVDSLILCATHPNAAGQTYLVSDGEDVSTSDLLRKLAEAMGQPARLFSCPPALLKLAGWLIGRSDQIDRLLSSLQVNSSKIRRELDWQPPFTLQEGLKKTVQGLS